MRIGGALIASVVSGLWSAGVAAAEVPICADRPGLATGTCTVPAGKVQFEIGLMALVRDRSDGARTDEVTLGETAIIYGVTDRLQLQVDLTPYSRVRERDGEGRDRASGFGDLVVRAKYRLTSEDSPVQLAISPFVKIPTARRSLGNGKVEGGIVVPAEWAIPRSPLSLTLSPEAAVLADSDGSGRHLAIAQAVSLGAEISPRLGVALDLWAQWDRDPTGTLRQYAVGPSVAYLVSNGLQVDAGIDFGLNRHTSDLAVYTGIAVRF